MIEVRFEVQRDGRYWTSDDEARIRTAHCRHHSNQNPRCSACVIVACALRRSLVRYPEIVRDRLERV